MRNIFRLLVINPGSTSTKIGIYDNKKCVFQETLRHDSEELHPFPRIMDQYVFRKRTILDTLNEKGMNITKLNAVVGRGGVLRSIPSGTYEVNGLMLEDLKTARYGEHASNLGALIAHEIASPLRIPAYIVDPVVVDELQDVARFSGMPLLKRKSIFHALNQKAVARSVALEMERSYEDLNMIVAHMGGGISVGVHAKGKVIDVNNALAGEGPFSPERAGTVPAGDLVRLCYSGEFTFEQMMSLLIGQGGLVGYLGTNSAQEVENKMDLGDEEARLVYEAMAYQVAKEIGAAAAVLAGHVDVIILTGGLARGHTFVQKIVNQIGWISSIKIVPGENELQALAEGGLRILQGEELPKVYPLGKIQEVKPIGY